MTNTIQFTHADGIAVLTFNRPAQRNALDTAAMIAFAERIAQIAADAAQHDLFRALIITGAGTNAFCSGADLVEMSGKPSAADGLAMSARMGDALMILEALPFPTIAAINGYALGGGAEVALACDLRIIDAAARIGFVQARRGLTPGWGGGQRLLRLVGYPRALEILLEARILDADTAHTAGLVERIAPAGGALDAARAFAAEIAQRDPAVVRSIKTLLRAGWMQPYPQALMSERALFPPLWAGDARKAATQSFLEKSDKS
ncbi:MAG: enoyl-CoA hydratase/isomerase family protein [Chloroflexota bacterium]|nr:enoyl-CoA hydratase/isomerase family protein [Chloroflexota bacterium]